MSNEMIIINSKHQRLDENYYPVWSADMHLLLCSEDLDDYIYEDRMKRIKKEDEEYDESCIEVRRMKDMYYVKGVTKEMIRKDCRVKLIMSLNLNYHDKKCIDFSRSAYEIWNDLEKAYQKDTHVQIAELRNELNSMVYDLNDDNIYQFIFNIKNIFHKLSTLNYRVTEDDKVTYLLKSLPQNVLRESSIISFMDDFEKCCQYLLRIIPKLKEEEKCRQNKTCFVCHKKGHVARDCQYKI